MSFNLHRHVSILGLQTFVRRFAKANEEHCDMETYSHAVEGMTEEEEQRSLRNYVEACKASRETLMAYVPSLVPYREWQHPGNESS